MSIFGTILSKIFPSHHPAVAQNTSSAAATPSTSASGPAATSSTPSVSSSAASLPPVDVEAVLNGLGQKTPEKLNWRTSIVDLMKLVGMDSSMGARKALAQELHYTGDTNDSASMNMWLHKQVMKRSPKTGASCRTI